MNRIGLIRERKDKLDRYIVNGMEVSRAVWLLSMVQNDRLRDIQLRLRTDGYIRPWNKVRLHERAALIRKSLKASNCGYSYIVRAL